MSGAAAGAAMLTVAGVVVGMTAALRKHPRAGLLFMLELWTAAGLLRLSSELDRGKLAVAAIVLAVRHLAAGGSRRARQIAAAPE